jgi:hypothetical protein
LSLFFLLGQGKIKYSELKSSKDFSSWSRPHDLFRFRFPSSGSLLSFQVIEMSSRKATNVSWSEMVTGLLSCGLASRPLSVLTLEKGCPVRLHKCSTVEDFTRSPWARVLHIYDPWRKGGPAIIKPPDTELPVGPRILAWYSDRPNISVGIPHPPTGRRARWGLQGPHTGLTSSRL